MLGIAGAYHRINARLDAVEKDTERNEAEDLKRDDDLKAMFRREIDAKFAVGNEALKRHEETDQSLQRELTEFKAETKENFRELRQEVRDGFQRVFDRLEKRE